jgi:four helix bundle protein
MKKYAFESLNVWNESRLFVKWIYEITRHYPNSEIFGLVQQMRRASISVISNIAEGTSRKSYRDQAHFSQMSYSSILEILNHLIISVDLGLIDERTLTEGRQMIEGLTIKVAGLRKTQLRYAEDKNA